MAYIRKFRTGSGATGVQVCWKRGGKVVRTEHVGSADSEKGLEVLVEKARKMMLAEGQGALFDLDAVKKPQK